MLLQISDICTHGHYSLVGKVTTGKVKNRYSYRHLNAILNLLIDLLMFINVLTSDFFV